MKQFRILAIVLLAALITSCNKDSDNATGVGDVLIVAKRSGANTVYGISIYAYTFSAFQSVKVTDTSESGKTYDLQSNQGYKTNFYYEIPDAQFTTTKPTPATYNFSGIFENGATDEFQDVLTDKVLAPPAIEQCTYNSTKSLQELTWTTLSGADSYAINILDGTTIVFASAELANTVKTFGISSSGAGWITGFTPENGKAYTFKLYAFMYESGGDAYNVQSTSVSEITANWGASNP
jgi:hypothetical protein